MAPIRVGLIGLSGQPREKRDGISWAEIAHLQYFRSTAEYQIRALLNSSVESARAAIQRHELAVNTKAYGDPNAFANDDEIDLIVCCVRVDKHFQTVKPSIVAGKAVYVEWPLERSIHVAKEMCALVALHNAKAIVGLQASFSPVIRKIKQIIDSGTIGRLLSSSVVGSLGHGGATEPKPTSFFLDRETGGNLMSIHGAHALEYIIAALGDFTTFKGACAIRRPFKDIVDPRNGNQVLEKAVRNTVPDHLLIHGTVLPSQAVVAIIFTGGDGIPGLPILDWRIQGEYGWLRLTSSSMALNVGSPDTKLELYDASGKAREIAPDEDQWSKLPLPAQNIARLYEAFRKKDWYPDLDYAIKRHELIETMWRDFDQAEGKTR
ncbi:hypothetical protein ACHAP3_010839 [Botrytis cinerea]